jgi:hypothetical protein
MIAIPDFIRMLSIENKLIHDQANGLSQTDTLIQPRPSGNCMNWILGHLLDNQITLLNVLGGISPIDPAEVARYQRESAPILAEGPGVLKLERLLEGHDLLSAAIAARLGEMTDTDFSQEIEHQDRKVTRGWRTLFLQFHYTYHVGQLEQLRQLAGKKDKII